MKWIDLFRLSAQSLWRRKLRTILTMVGVMIGTASIVVMVSLGIGINQGYIESLSQSGMLTRIEVNSQTYWGDGGVITYTPEGSTEQETVKAQKLDDAMVRKIAMLDHVESVTPMMNINNCNVSVGKLQSYYSLVAVKRDALDALDISLSEGSGFSKQGSGDTIELILGEGTLYSFRNPRSNKWNDEVPDVDWLNAKFTVTFYNYNDIDSEGNPAEINYKARVVGIIPSDNEMSYNIYTDIETMQRIINKNKKTFKDSGTKTDQYQNGYVRVDDFNNAISVQKQLQSMGLNAWSYAEMINDMQNSSASLQLMLGGIGAVAMLVAAISITNTMMMSIYERTREIGVMKVLGCRMSSIGAMFLCEAGMIGFGGGIIGLGLSFLLSWIINFVMAAAGSMGGFRSVIPAYLALGALLFSTVIGVVAGLMPSRRAMRMSALAAIRNE